MDNIVSWTVEDEAIIATNTDATECKRCAVELGYWKDDYIKYFAKHVDRKAPEINRGYYARVKAMEMFIHQFLERCDTKCQIINLGCGFDTLYWRLKDTTQAVANFIELDFPAVVRKKYQIIKRNKQLLEKICNEDGEVVIRSGDVHAAGYHLAACDLRCEREVARQLAACEARADAPTLLLAECVLVYLRPGAGDALLRQLAAAFPRAALLLYEQCNLADRFGEVMLRNLHARGVSLEGAAAAGPPHAQARRALAAGWARARSWDMREVWRALPDADRARADRLEPLDERELLQQLHAHYALTVASRGEIFADLDLHA
ncbi:leucine carboxyl methyltransferase 1 [Leptidea sinapis]|uniref:leucine carboxyl methyltransferase 1 n=1 Tax=Leptidea sinapis TaxID=189913 RepID=UPI00214259BD|nr:leucine carboxyl methyltransferase 1 [Leptidea sinapis]XP_050680609.1 leucine carboxyl methyltransferase 1 [Leptidea sinapis]